MWGRGDPTADHATTVRQYVLKGLATVDIPLPSRYYLGDSEDIVSEAVIWRYFAS